MTLYLHPVPLPLHCNNRITCAYRLQSAATLLTCAYVLQSADTDYSLLLHSLPVPTDYSLLLHSNPKPHTLNLILLLHILKLTFTLRGLPRPNAQLGAHTGCISPNDVPRSAFVSNPAVIGILGPYFSTIQETMQGC